MLGDNIYGGKSQQDFERKFELPYKPLLDAGVKFYASIGNHDNPNERLYKPFNMGGARYYSFKKEMPLSLRWTATIWIRPSWTGWRDNCKPRTRSGRSASSITRCTQTEGVTDRILDLRAVLTPLFEKYGVNVALSGHDHVYERIKPENGTYYFVLGNSGELRYHNLKPSADMAAGFDTDCDFMLVEIAGDKFYFQTISRTGKSWTPASLTGRNGDKVAWRRRSMRRSSPRQGLPCCLIAPRRTQPAVELPLERIENDSGQLAIALDTAIPSIITIVGRRERSDSGPHPSCELLRFSRRPFMIRLLRNTLALITALACLSLAASADLKIKTRTTVMGHSSESTVYIKGPRQRSEMSFGGHGGAATIIQCDQKRMITISGNRCMVMPMGGGETSCPTIPNMGPWDGELGRRADAPAQRWRGDHHPHLHRYRRAPGHVRLQGAPHQDLHDHGVQPRGLQPVAHEDGDGWLVRRSLGGIFLRR